MVHLMENKTFSKGDCVLAAHLSNAVYQDEKDQERIPYERITKLVCYS